MVKIAPLKFGKKNAQDTLEEINHQVGDLIRDYGDAEEQELIDLPIAAISEIEAFALGLLQIVESYRQVTTNIKKRPLKIVD